MRGMTHRRLWNWFLACAWGSAVCLPAVLGGSREGEVLFSDGSALTGAISLAPGGELKIQAQNQLRVLPFEQVREIRLVSEHEELAQKWRFVEAGQAAKQREGKPYPLRNLQAVILLADGSSSTGHLHTTALQVETGDKTQKIILYSKQRGREGETLAALVYPARITFADAPPASSGTIRLKISLAEAATPSEVAVLVRGSLDRFHSMKPAAPGEFEMPNTLGQEFFLAAKCGAQIAVGWPRDPAANLAALVNKSLPLAEDFFDQRQLLGVWEEAPQAQVYSLVLLIRQGKTTLAETRSQPWRLAVFRWKRQDDRLLLAGQNYLFRGILAKNEKPPVIALSESLWKIRRQDGARVAGPPVP